MDIFPIYVTFITKTFKNVLPIILCFFKGCGMGPLLVLVSPCFRENVVATCKIWSFLEIKFQNGAHLKKKGYFWPTIHNFLVTREKVTNISPAHISLTYIHVFCSPYWLLLPYQFWKKYKFIRYGFSLVWVLVFILIRAIMEQSINNKMVSKI